MIAPNPRLSSFVFLLGAVLAPAAWAEQPGNLVVTFKSPGTFEGVAFSPDGRHLAFAGPDGVKLVNADTGEKESTLDNPASKVFLVTFAPDGQRLASGGRDRTVRIWNLLSRTQLVLKGHVHPLCGLAFSPDGKRLASADESGWVKVWDPVSGKLRHAFRLRSGYVESEAVAFSRDLRHVAGVCVGGTVTVSEVATGQVTMAVRMGNAEVNTLAFSPDGDQLAGGGTKAWVWDTATGRELCTLGLPAVERVMFHADGRRLTTFDSRHVATVWGSATGKQVAILEGRRGPLVPLAYSPDGRRLASTGEDHEIEVWNLSWPTGPREGK
jgi:WD40 repeat protein